MSWFCIDDKIAFHRKTVDAGNAAFGAWVRLGSWSSDHNTDGFVPASVARTMATPKELARCLKVSFLDAAEGGYAIHNFLVYNPSAAQVSAKRAEQHEAKVRAGKVGGVRSGAARRTKQPASDNEAPCSPDASPETKQNEAPSRPVPSRPLHTHTAGAPEAPISPDGARALEVLRSLPALAPIATLDVAEALVASGVMAGRTPDEVTQGIRELGAKAAIDRAGNAAPSHEALLDLARRYVTSKPRRVTQGGRGAPPVQPATNRGWKPPKELEDT